MNSQAAARPRSIGGHVEREVHRERAIAAAPFGTEPLELALSENPFPPLPSVLDAVSQTLARANRYPEFLPDQLPKVIGNHLGFDADQVVVGSGATGVAMQIMQALALLDDRMVFGAPTFDGYPIMAEMVGLEAVPVPLNCQGRQDLSAMARAVDDRTALLVVCRPHNPTGTVCPAGELEALCEDVPRRVTIVLDEAYAEFLSPVDTIDTASLIQRHPNVLVLRTFSKAYGLAGLRIGYAVGQPDVVRRVRRLQLPFGVSTAAVAAVTASYAAEAELAERIRQINAEREWLRNGLLQLGIPTPQGHANFLYLPGCDVADRLARGGINAKAYPDGSARIAVGDPAAGRAVLKALNGVHDAY